MKKIIFSLISFLFLFSCTKQNQRINDDCEICGTWNLDSSIEYSQPYPSTSNPSVSQSDNFTVIITSDKWIEDPENELQIEMFPDVDSIIFTPDYYRGKYTLINDKLVIDGDYIYRSGKSRETFFLTK